MSGRTRRQIGISETNCDICGTRGLPVFESRITRRGLALINPWWHQHRRTYEQCPACGMKYRLKAGRRV